MKIKETIMGMLTGIGIGIPVALVCMISIGGYNAVIQEFLVWTVASALFGVLSVLIFNDKMNLILSTALHCVACLLVTIGACAINGYGKNVFDILLSVAPIFVIVYVVIYFVTFFSMKSSAKKTNEALSKK